MLPVLQCHHTAQEGEHWLHCEIWGVVFVRESLIFKTSHLDILEDKTIDFGVMLHSNNCVVIQCQRVSE